MTTSRAPENAVTRMLDHVAWFDGWAEVKPGSAASLAALESSRGLAHYLATQEQVVKLAIFGRIHDKPIEQFIKAALALERHFGGSALDRLSKEEADAAVASAIAALSATVASFRWNFLDEEGELKPWHDLSPSKRASIRRRVSEVKESAKRLLQQEGLDDQVANQLARAFLASSLNQARDPDAIIEYLRDDVLPLVERFPNIAQPYRVAGFTLSGLVRKVEPAARETFDEWCKENASILERVLVPAAQVEGARMHALGCLAEFAVSGPSELDDTFVAGVLRILALVTDRELRSGDARYGIVWCAFLTSMGVSPAQQPQLWSEFARCLQRLPKPHVTESLMNFANGATAGRWFPQIPPDVVELLVNEFLAKLDPGTPGSTDLLDGLVALAYFAAANNAWPVVEQLARFLAECGPPARAWHCAVLTLCCDHDVAPDMLARTADVALHLPVETSPDAAEATCELLLSLSSRMTDDREWDALIECYRKVTELMDIEKRATLDMRLAASIARGVTYDPQPDIGRTLKAYRRVRDIAARNTGTKEHGSIQSALMVLALTAEPHLDKSSPEHLEIAALAKQAQDMQNSAQSILAKGRDYIERHRRSAEAEAAISSSDIDQLLATVPFDEEPRP